MHTQNGRFIDFLLCHYFVKRYYFAGILLRRLGRSSIAVLQLAGTPQPIRFLIFLLALFHIVSASAKA